MLFRIMKRGVELLHQQNIVLKKLPVIMLLFSKFRRQFFSNTQAHYHSLRVMLYPTIPSTRIMSRLTVTIAPFVRFQRQGGPDTSQAVEDNNFIFCRFVTSVFSEKFIVIQGCSFLNVLPWNVYPFVT